MSIQAKAMDSEAVIIDKGDVFNSAGDAYDDLPDMS